MKERARRLVWTEHVSEGETIGTGCGTGMGECGQIM